MDEQVGEDDVVWSEDEDTDGADRQRGTSLLGKRARSARSVSARPGKRHSSVRAASAQVGTPLTPLTELPEQGAQTPGGEAVDEAIGGEDEGADGDEAEAEDEEEEEIEQKKQKVWKEADCRIIVNVRVPQVHVPCRC